jgi:hypothetical protein
MAAKYLVPAAQWRRGVAATERLGRLLKDWEERGRAFRAEADADPPPAPRQGADRAADDE